MLFRKFRINIDTFLPALNTAAAALALYFFLGCDRTTNKVDELRLQCGVDLLEYEVELPLVKFLDSKTNQALTVENLSLIGITPNKEAVSLKSTSRACFAIPKNILSLRVRATRDGEIIGSVIDISELKGGSINNFKLSILPIVKYKFVCPTDGIYGRDSIDLPLSFDISGDQKSVGLQILARSLRDKSIIPLATKSIGESLEDFGAGINIKELPPGGYDIMVATSSLKLSLSESYDLIDSNSSCTLQKVDALPALLGSDKSVVKAINSPLFEFSSDSNAYYCKTRISDLDSEILSDRNMSANLRQPA